ncbi:hypothetical protein ONZ45_g4490 [Pleurotus djamor]|nr:hypothetical protein ONZ45_g4490 [Pleurotus djamor]
MMTDSYQQSLQLKGEIMDLEFTLDSDHRDDPSIDENTRLRNRIAELESLVRELRGKPHPRWADSNFGNGDPSEKWHSRASKSHAQGNSKQPPPPPGGGNQNNHGVQSMRNGAGGVGGVMSSLLTPIKTEANAESMHAQLYRFTPSPGPSGVRYSAFHGEPRSPSTSSFEGDQRHPLHHHASSNSPPMPFHPSTSAPPMSYVGHPNSGGESPYSDTRNGHATINGSQNYQMVDNRTYTQPQTGYTSSNDPMCPCRTNPATTNTYILLSQQVQSTLSAVRQYNNHPPDSRCLLYRRILELHNQLQLMSLPMRISGNDPTDAAGPSYDNLSSTPTDSEIMTPLSASSGHASFHATGSAGSGGVSPQEWNTLASAGYNPYFPLTSGEHHNHVYSHVIT